MNRREFLNWMGVGTLATSLPVAIAACQPETTEVPASPAADADTPEAETAVREDGFAVLGTVAELEDAGYLASVRFQGSRVIVTRNPANADALIAVNSVCTHAGCTVEWNENTFDCPCHESFFNLDGTVKSGPASEPLELFEAKIEGDQVLVKV